ncbi:hypothetical protein GCM10022287_36420 [Gryllotalpicola koreensis]|uniref:Secreted protein n=1 Tax=Gryllotalpicola koreensis TaxID=993086 RepID=A0ABP8ABN6_9MICO
MPVSALALFFASLATLRTRGERGLSSTLRVYKRVASRRRTAERCERYAWSEFNVTFAPLRVSFACPDDERPGHRSG